jgi:signal transduction histidine kinase
MEQTTPSMTQSLRWLERQSRPVVYILALLMIASIGMLSYQTGPQWSSSFFYLIPILVVARNAGLVPGLVAAVLAATVWLSVDMCSGTYYLHPVTPFWNALMRFATFVVAVFLVASMRSLNARLEDRVVKRTAALNEQMRENRKLERAILEISDNEQAKIGQDLHDGLCQKLVGAAFSANMLRENLATESGTQWLGDADRICNLIDDSITQARNLARGLYPVRLESEGLEMALREIAAATTHRAGTTCSVICPDRVEPRLAGAGIHLYRIAQEAVTNAVKHARCSQITMFLRQTGGRLILTIEDDGTGIRNSGPEAGMGLPIMQYRARMIGADLEIKPREGGGTAVICNLESLTQ